MGGIVSNLFGGGGSAPPAPTPQQYDPFQPFRTQYATKLQQFMNNPASVSTLPGYQFMQNQGAQQVQRSMAAQGKNLSGAELLALQQQGQGTANQFYGQHLGTLMQLSGASQSPAAGYGAAMQGYGAMQNAQNTNQGGMGALGSLFQGISSFFNSDIRLKTNIKHLGTYPNGLTKYSFEYRNDPGVEHIGVMAQEVLEFYPYAVRIGEDGYYQVNYDTLGITPDEE